MVRVEGDSGKDRPGGQRVSVVTGGGVWRGVIMSCVSSEKCICHMLLSLACFIPFNSYEFDADLPAPHPELYMRRVPQENTTF